MEKEMYPAAPGILIVEHPREKKHKCTVAVLKGRPDIEFIDPGSAVAADFADAILLDAQTEEVLDPSDAGRRLILIDASWRWAGRVAAKMKAVRRSLPPFETAYPRSSKIFRDPPGGLASAEALFVASLVFGRRDDSLLDGYFWKKEFLEINRERILALAAR